MPRGKVLIAFDGSARAHRAIRAAGDLLDEAEALVLHVGDSPLPPPTLPFPAGAAPIPTLPVTPGHDEAAARDHAREVAGQGVEAAAAAGLRATPVAVLAEGGASVPEKIVEVADEYDVALIVLGSHGHSALRAALLGSVSMGVLHRTRRPVLVVPEPH